VFVRGVLGRLSRMARNSTEALTIPSVLGGGSNTLSRGKEIVVKPEQLLAFRTSSPLEVTIVLVDGHQIVPADASGPQLQGRSVSSIQPQ
jgi:hypothetical protein